MRGTFMLSAEAVGGWPLWLGDIGRGGLWQPQARRLRELLGLVFQICLHSCFQAKMVENCGCAQYSQPLPQGADYCNYQQHPNWSEWDTNTPHLAYPRSRVSPTLAIPKALPGPCPDGLWPEGDREILTSFTHVVKPGLNSTFWLRTKCYTPAFAKSLTPSVNSRR